MEDRKIRQGKSGKLLLAGVIVISLCILTAGLVYSWQKREHIQPEFVFRYAENQVDDFPTTEGAKYFAQLVNERSEGRIVIRVYPDAELGREDEVIDQLQYGGIDFARVSISQLVDLAPELYILQLPYLYESSEHMWTVLDGNIGRKFLQTVSKDDLVGLSWYDAGARSFYNSVRPIKSPADLEGMRIRVQESDLMEDIVTSLGAIPIPLAYDEVYSALERGIVDGAENNLPSYVSMQHYETAPYYTLDEHVRIPEIQLCSAHTWALLSAEDQELIREAAEESALYERKLWAERESNARKTLEEYDMQPATLTPEERDVFRKSLSGVYEKYGGEYTDLIQEIQSESP